MRLVLFFSKNMSLSHWYESGMFDREVAIYQRLSEFGVLVTFITYGNSKDLKYRNRLSGIDILCNRWSLPNILYNLLLPILHWKSLSVCDLIKTNQVNGSDIALRSAKYWNKPLIARMGYLLSDFTSKDKYALNSLLEYSLKIEHKLFNSSDKIVVTTDEMSQNIRDRLPHVKSKIVVIPNYVEIERFAPNHTESKEFDILFVGRLSPQKNLKPFLNALRDIDATAMIIGNGELKNDLQSEFYDLKQKITWKGNIPNSELPLFMNRSSLFILPSHYEGHPKTLIEAMSCNLPVIGADSPGIREIIKHRVNGYLCGTDSDSIRLAIEELLANPSLRKFLGENARKYIVDNFSLDRILQMEYDLYREILSEKEIKVLN